MPTAGGIGGGFQQKKGYTFIFTFISTKHNRMYECLGHWFQKLPEEEEILQDGDTKTF